MEAINEIIRKRRRELNMTQQELADILHISDRVVSKWETGRGLPDVQMLNPLAEALQIEPIRLLNSKELNIDTQSRSTKDAFRKFRTKLKIGMLVAIVTLVISLIFYGMIIANKLSTADDEIAKTIYVVFCTIFAVASLSSIIITLLIYKADMSGEQRSLKYDIFFCLLLVAYIYLVLLYLMIVLTLDLGPFLFAAPLIVLIGIGVTLLLAKLLHLKFVWSYKPITILVLTAILMFLGLMLGYSTFDNVTYIELGIGFSIASLFISFLLMLFVKNNYPVKKIIKSQ